LEREPSSARGRNYCLGRSMTHASGFHLLIIINRQIYNLTIAIAKIAQRQ
jgi:hypothetical protein